MRLPSARMVLATALSVALTCTTSSAWSRPGANRLEYDLVIKSTPGLNGSPATGFGTVTVDDPLPVLPMRVQVSFTGLLGRTTAAEIHCCTNAPGNVGVAIETPSFGGFPFGVTEGFMDHTFDLALAPTYSSSFIRDNGGTAESAFAALAAGMDAGQSYFIIRTEAFPDGEIRGFITPIPVPSTYALLVMGLAGIGLTARRGGRQMAWACLTTIGDGARLTSRCRW